MAIVLKNLQAVRLATAASASASIGEGENGVVTVTVIAPGPAGNAYTLEVVEGEGVESPLAAVLEGTAITVTLATDGDELPDDAANTATLIAAAIDELAGVTAEASGTGETAIAGAVALVPFTGGRDCDSITEVARRSVFGSATLARVELGRSVMPHEADRIAAALGVSLETLGAEDV